jgi:predicted DNA binding protein
MSAVHGEYITNIIKLTSPDPKKDIERIRKHPLVKEVEILMNHSNTVLMRVVSKYEAMTYRVLHKTNVTLVESPITKDGVDSEILLANSHKDMSDLISRWKEQDDYDEVKLKRKRYVKKEDANSLNVFSSSGFFDLKAAKELLSEKQLKIFKLACEYGYYDMPKKVSIEQMAQRSGISQSTLAEHLRKAETKLLPILWKVMAKM